MRTYGIDAHLLLRSKKDGVPRYTQLLLQHMMRMPLAPDERVILYGNGQKPTDLLLPEGWSWKILRWILPRGWTHGRLSAEMVMHPPDVLFVPGHEVPMIVSKSVRVVTTIHDVAFRTTPDVYSVSARRRQEMAIRRAIRRAGNILTPSEATKYDVVHEYNVPADRIVVTPLAPTIVPIDRNDADLFRQWSLTRGQYILYIGRLEKKKNTVLLLRAFAVLKRKLGTGHPLTLVLAGAFGDAENEIRQVIVRENIAKDVRLTGYVSDDEASMLLRHAWCFAFPSRAEGFGIPILEAMAHGVPVIASNIPAIREVSEESALLVSPNDATAFMRAFEQLLFDGGLREEYRERGLARAAQFSWHTTAEKTWRVLRGAL
jgi:glycosyltransferase involved in cell wall biosynthesis